MLHEKSQASILLETDLGVCSVDYHCQLRMGTARMKLDEETENGERRRIWEEIRRQRVISSGSELYFCTTYSKYCPQHYLTNLTQHQ